MSDLISKTWFCVLNNPADRGYPGTPEEVCNQLMAEWISDSPTRTGWWGYCISADGLHHVHMVLEDQKTMRFSLIKKAYACGMHFEETKGTKAQVEAYINKEPPYDEKGETIIYSISHGEIQATQGKRSDLEIIADLIAAGMTPSEIYEVSFSYRRYSQMIEKAFMDKRYRETPVVRELKVHYYCGASGTGKSHKFKELCDEHGENAIYHVSDYQTGYLDTYEAEPILFLDEFKGELKYGQLLSLLDVYKTQIHCRYANRFTLWREVYIASIYSLEDLYKIMVSEYLRDKDPFQQLLRRITDITYCYRVGNTFRRFTIPASEYIGYAELRNRALERDNTQIEDVPPRFYDLS